MKMSIKVCSLFIFGLLFTSACRKHTVPVPYQDDEAESMDSVVFEAGIAAGTLTNRAIDEASGMDMSILHPYKLWTHNDSGDKPRLYLLDTLARHLRTFTVENSDNRDWEDIAVARDPVSGRSRIFIADIGDNLAVYDHGRIFLADEPLLQNASDSVITPVNKIVFRYDDGRRDAESLMVDPLSGDIFLISKRETNVHLYRITYPYNMTDTVTAVKVLEMPYTYIVAADISHDGTEILLKNYDKIWHWYRKKGSTVAEALAGIPTELTYLREPQGESLCWGMNTTIFYTLSEESLFKVTPVLYKYKRK